MATNWGIGAGAFAQGLTQGLGTGLQTGNALKKARDNREIETIRTQGINEARERREADINSQIKPAREGGVSMGYMDGTGKVHGSRDDARKSAEGSVDSVIDYYMQTAGPKLKETYIQQGDIQKAEAFDRWMQESKVKKGMKHWATAMRSAQAGDHAGFADNLKKAYNTQGYFEDGMTAESVKPVKGDNGEVSAYEVTIKGRDGSKSTQQIGMEEMYRVGLGFLAPEQVFETGWNELQEAKRMRAEHEAQLAKEDRGFRRDIALEDRKSGNRQQEIVTREQAQARYKQNGTRQDYEANVDILRQAGFGDNEIKELTPRILGVANTRARASETDLRSQALKMLTSDYMGRREFNALSPEEQERKISAIVQTIQGQQN